MERTGISRRIDTRLPCYDARPDPLWIKIGNHNVQKDTVVALSEHDFVVDDNASAVKRPNRLQAKDNFRIRIYVRRNPVAAIRVVRTQVGVTVVAKGEAVCAVVKTA